MKEFSLDSIAQGIVDATSSFVKTRTINIMDTNGIIIASSDKSRIGSLHSGAQEAIKTGRSVEIRPEDVLSYVGAKEGINTPIIHEGRIVGVVGIYGVPNEVRDTASLLSVCVGLYLEQGDLLEHRAHVKLLRNRLFEVISEGGEDARMRECFASLGLRFTPPYYPLLLSFDDVCDYQVLLQYFHSLSLFSRKSDVILERTDSALVLICGAEHPSSESLFKGLANLSHIGFGYPCMEIRELSDCLHFLRQYQIITKRREFSLSSFDDLALFALNKEGEEIREKLTLWMRERLLFAPWAEETARAFLRSDGHLEDAAVVLNVHKNTVFYRMKQIWAKLYLDSASSFARAYFLALALLW